jgi:hypothetical protein
MGDSACPTAFRDFVLHVWSLQEILVHEIYPNMVGIVYSALGQYEKAAEVVRQIMPRAPT